MDFFSRLFGEKRIRSATLFEISAGTVGGAIVCMREGARPVLLYATRAPIEPHPGEAPLAAMVRTLAKVTEILQREGAPLLLRESGSGRADEVLVSVDAPWQSTSLRIEDIEGPRAFTFSRRIVDEALRREAKTPPGQVLADESIVGTILNGYETARPYGKETTRARILVLVSHIAQEAADAVAGALRSAYHSRDIRLLAGASMRTQGVRAAFPIERDLLILDASGSEISIALVRRGLLTAIEDVPDGAPDTDAWVVEVKRCLETLAGRYPLPRVVFLLSPSAATARALAEKLSAASFRELWLSENPPKILALAPSHLNALLAAPLDASSDLLLALMTVFWASRQSELYPSRDSAAR